MISEFVAPAPQTNAFVSDSNFSSVFGATEPVGKIDICISHTHTHTKRIDFVFIFIFDFFELFWFSNNISDAIPLHKFIHFNAPTNFCRMKTFNKKKEWCTVSLAMITNPIFIGTFVNGSTI